MFPTTHQAVLFWLLIGHAIADYPLQGDWLSKAKNPTLDLVGETIWPLALGSHAAIHAGAIWFVTGSAMLGAFEFVAHALIDYGKCTRWLTYNGDQLMHIVCKCCWALIFAMVF